MDNKFDRFCAEVVKGVDVIEPVTLVQVVKVQDESESESDEEVTQKEEVKDDAPDDHHLTVVYTHISEMDNLSLVKVAYLMV